MRLRVLAWAVMTAAVAAGQSFDAKLGAENNWDVAHEYEKLSERCRTEAQQIEDRLGRLDPQARQRDLDQIRGEVVAGEREKAEARARWDRVLRDGAATETSVMAAYPAFQEEMLAVAARLIRVGIREREAELALWKAQRVPETERVRMTAEAQLLRTSAETFERSAAAAREITALRVLDWRTQLAGADGDATKDPARTKPQAGGGKQ